MRTHARTRSHATVRNSANKDRRSRSESAEIEACHYRTIKHLVCVANNGPSRRACLVPRALRIYPRRFIYVWTQWRFSGTTPAEQEDTPRLPWHIHLVASRHDDGAARCLLAE